MKPVLRQWFSDTLSCISLYKVDSQVATQLIKKDQGWQVLQLKRKRNWRPSIPTRALRAPLHHPRLAEPFKDHCSKLTSGSCPSSPCTTSPGCLTFSACVLPLAGRRQNLCPGGEGGLLQPLVLGFFRNLQKSLLPGSRLDCRAS